MTYAPERPRGRALASLCAFAFFAPIACRSPSPSPTKPVPKPTASAKPLDRLEPGELAPGLGQVFGLPVPEGMRIKGAFDRSAFLEGNVRPEALANYVKDRVNIEHVEIGAARTVFPGARIHGGAPERRYEIEVIAGDGRPTQLVVRDITPHGRNGPATMTEADRWRQAGRAPDGRPLDPSQLR